MSHEDDIWEDFLKGKDPSVVTMDGEPVDFAKEGDDWADAETNLPEPLKGEGEAAGVYIKNGELVAEGIEETQGRVNSLYDEEEDDVFLGHDGNSSGILNNTSNWLRNGRSSTWKGDE